MSQQISEKWNKPFSRSVTYLTGTGDEVVIAQQLCNTCGNYIRASEPHTQCIRQRREEAAAEQERVRQQQCLEMFGQVLSKTEMERRLYPDSKVWGQESYNQQLEREAREKEQARLKVIRDRAEHKRMLEQMKDDIKTLERQIIRDEAEEAAEQQNAT